MARAPRRPALGELGPREGDHEDRMVPRRLEQVLDEVEQARVGPLHVLEREDCRVRLGEPLEEEPPRAEELLTLARLVIAEPEQLREPRLDERAIVGVEQMLVERRVQLLQRRGGLVVLGDPAAHAHHVGERPVRDAVAVGEAAAAMPVDDLLDPVEVLVELPGEARLADAGDAGHRHELRTLLVGGRVEELLDLPELAVAADERRLEALRLERARSARRRHAARATTASRPPCP